MRWKNLSQPRRRGLFGQRLRRIGVFLERTLVSVADVRPMPFGIVLFWLLEPAELIAFQIGDNCFRCFDFN